MKPNVLILGGGASAAFCYRACKDFGAEAEIQTLDIGAQSVGAFYIHWLPGSVAVKAPEPVDVLYVGMGHETDYIRKQWPNSKDHWDEPSSFPIEPVVKRGWDGRKALELLIEDADINKVGYKLSDTDIKDMAVHYDLVFHTFPSQFSVTQQPVPAIVPIVKYPNPDFEIGANLRKLTRGFDNFILYNGKDEPDWVRMSYLFGTVSWEYSYLHPLSQEKSTDDFPIVRYAEPVPGTKPFTKLIAKNVIPIGRMARWDRKYLSHKAYKDTRSILKEFEAGGKDYHHVLSK